MAEEIQYIIDQIQKEGVEKASEEATKIIESAKEEAKKIISNAEKVYKEKCEFAKTEAVALEEKSINSIKQASRDLLILLGKKTGLGYTGINVLILIVVLIIIFSSIVLNIYFFKKLKKNK